MRQWFGVTANAVLNTRWTQFINHANYKIIDSNVMDCAKVTKIPSPPSAKRHFPPWRACAVQRQFCDQKWRAIESHCWHRTAWWKCVFRVSWTLNVNDWNANCLFAINAHCLGLLFPFFAINCQRNAQRALYFGILLASPSRKLAAHRVNRDLTNARRWRQRKRHLKV